MAAGGRLQHRHDSVPDGEERPSQSEERCRGITQSAVAVMLSHTSENDLKAYRALPRDCEAEKLGCFRKA